MAVGDENWRGAGRNSERYSAIRFRPMNNCLARGKHGFPMSTTREHLYTYWQDVPFLFRTTTTLDSWTDPGTVRVNDEFKNPAPDGCNCERALPGHCFGGNIRAKLS